MCALLTSASCTYLLDFEPTDAGGDPSDASYLDSAPLEEDASADLYEPNDSPESAKPIEPGTYELSIFPQGDQDYWQIVLSGAADLIVDLTITGGADLDLELYSISELTTPLAWSRSSTDQERIARTTEENGQIGPGVFLIRVYAFVHHAPATYELTVTVDE